MPLYPPSTGGGASAATQAEEEAASSTTVYSSPGREQYHPGVAKGWVVFNGTGTPAITASRNVTSITDNGTGNYTINWTTSFSSANYAWAGSAQRDNSTTAALDWVTGYSTASNPATGSLRIQVSNSAASAVDSTYVCVAAYGDQ